MRHFIFKSNTNDKVYTTNYNGKMLFPHRDMGEINISSIGIIDDFSIVFEKERYGFFTGKVLDICKPTYEELSEFISLHKEDIVLYNARIYPDSCDNGFIVQSAGFVGIITKIVSTGEIIYEHQSRYNVTDDCANAIYNKIYDRYTRYGYLDIDNFIIPEPLSDIDIAKLAFSIVTDSNLLRSFSINTDKWVYTNYGILQYDPYQNKLKISDSISIFNNDIFKFVTKKAKILSKEYYQEKLLEYWDLGFYTIYRYSNSLLPEELWDKLFIGLVDRDIPLLAYNINKYDEVMALDPELKEFLDSKIKESKEEMNRLFKAHGKLGIKNIDNIRKYDMKKYITIK